jgi:uncharacterized protein (TIGR00725 family)
MELKLRPRIGVMGPAVCSPRCRQLAREVGRIIGREGGILICGGLGGVMESAAQGTKESGGITIGILPRALASEANPYIDIPIVSDMGNARNVINVLTSQAVIAIQGAYGTLSEIALALKCGTPVVGLETWSLVPPEGNPNPDIAIAGTPEEAVTLALKFIRK